MSYPGTADTLANFGGALVDFGAVSVVDPTTDRSAAAVNQAFADVAMMTHTATRAWVRFVGNATTPTIAVSNGSDAAWGNSSGVLPTVVHTATGVYTITWPATIVDELGVTQGTLIRNAIVNVEGSTPYGPPQYAVTAANVVVVYTFNTSFAANDLVGVTIHVRCG